MARPLRIEFEGAFYHVMARGNARQSIFLDDGDRQSFIDNLGRVCQRFDWMVWAWCLMDDYYHLLIETCQPTLSIQRVCARSVAFARRRSIGATDEWATSCRGVQGHPGGPDAYLLELARYIVFNPVSAHSVQSAGESEGRSHKAVAGKISSQEWLAVDDISAGFE